MAREQEEAWGHVPQPAGRLLDEYDKQRCALLMQHKGNIPASELMKMTTSNRCSSLLSSKPVPVNARGQVKSEITGSRHLQHCNSSDKDDIKLQLKELQERFTEIADEVAERQDFIASMQQLGKLQVEHLNAIRAEVALKVRQMGQLDAKIRELGILT